MAYAPAGVGQYSAPPYADEDDDFGVQGWTDTEHLVAQSVSEATNRGADGSGQFSDSGSSGDTAPAQQQPAHLTLGGYSSLSLQSGPSPIPGIDSDDGGASFADQSDEEDDDDEEIDPSIGMGADGIPLVDISEQEAEERRIGASLRRRWMTFVKWSTFFVSDRYIRSKLPGCLGPAATDEQLLAWREKLTMFDMLLGLYIIVAVVFLILPIIFCAQGPGDATGLLSKDVWYCWTYDIFVLFYAVMSAIVVIFTLYAAIRIRFQTAKKRQDQSDSLVILHIPCYSEDEVVLRKTIDSVVATDYPDSGKILWVIADGLVTGRGAAMSTPEILVESIFKCRSVPGYKEPLPKTYMSAGHSGAKMNAAKSYSGMFTVQGHTCPFLVTVKCGMPDEANAAKPGNRGKRDSQIIIYSFLYHYNFDRENMSELDHELAKNMFELGIDPADLDYMLLTDADSYVRPNALDLLVNYLDSDPSSIGACGETKVDNKLTSFICSIQTFEYFITHVVLKAFEGYYSKVLVLSGCFALYRIKIRDEDGVETPGIINPHIIEKYLGNKHKSLHEHNLLSIGEDRYLSTTIIRTFPEFDTVYIPSAICTTSVPENFQVLLSQRRRWTNSLVHCHFDHMMYPPAFKSKWMAFYFFLVIFLELWMVFMLPLLLTCGFFFLFYFAIVGFGTSGLILTVVLFCVPAFVVSFTGRWHQFFYWIPFIMGTPIFSVLIPVYRYGDGLSLCMTHAHKARNAACGRWMSLAGGPVEQPKRSQNPRRTRFHLWKHPRKYRRRPMKMAIRTSRRMPRTSAPRRTEQHRHILARTGNFPLDSPLHLRCYPPLPLLLAVSTLWLRLLGITSLQLRELRNAMGKTNPWMPSRRMAILQGECLPWQRKAGQARVLVTLPPCHPHWQAATSRLPTG
ncbi:chitin synthase-domain-containing protein [Hyaloraphidium curvatum]|nr:chitin synthase-domain-containing protein [Hyaloraphidium curvatum]